MLWRPGFLKKKEPSPNRLPEGQKQVKGWPVLHEGEEPVFDPAAWRLRIWGEVEQPVELDWAAFGALAAYAILIRHILAVYLGAAFVLYLPLLLLWRDRDRLANPGVGPGDERALAGEVEGDRHVSRFPYSALR